MVGGRKDGGEVGRDHNSTQTENSGKKIKDACLHGCVCVSARVY